MRVALIGNFPLDRTKIQGGVEAAFLYLVEGLSRLDGLQTDVLTMRPQDWAGPDVLHESDFTIHLMHSHRRFELATNFRTFQIILNEKLNQLSPDLIHVQDATDHAYVAIRSNYPVVLTVHGIRFEDSRYERSLRLRLRNFLFCRVYERYIMKHICHLVAISPYVSRYYASLLNPKAHIYSIPNALHKNYFHVEDTGNGKIILFAGRIIPRKCILELTRAFAQVAGQHQDVHLRLAGECISDPSYVSSVRKLITQLRLEKQVHLLGHLSEEEILNEFAGCSIVTLASAQETTPMVIAQAMAMGKPVVATRVGGIDDMVKDGETGILVARGDIMGLAEALKRVLQDTTLQRRLGEKARLLAEEHYHADRVAGRTFEVYKKIISGN